MFKLCLGARLWLGTARGAFAEHFYTYILHLVSFVSLISIGCLVQWFVRKVCHILVSSFFNQQGKLSKNFSEVFFCSFLFSFVNQHLLSSLIKVYFSKLSLYSTIMHLVLCCFPFPSRAGQNTSHYQTAAKNRKGGHVVLLAHARGHSQRCSVHFG